MHDSKSTELMQELCVCTNLRRATRAITRQYDRAYAGTGIRSTQSPILMALMVNGNLSMTRLAEGLGLDNSTLSRNFRVLEEAGLVARSAVDGRTFEARITADGVKQMNVVGERWKQIQNDAVATLGGDKSWKTVRETLALLDNLAGT